MPPESRQAGPGATPKAQPAAWPQAQPAGPKIGEPFRDSQQVNCKVTVPTTAQRAMDLLRSDFPEGEQHGPAFSYKTIWEFRGERAKVECIFIPNASAPDQKPAELSLAVIVDQSDFLPHTAAFALQTLQAGTRRQEGVEQMLGPSLQIGGAKPTELV